MAATSSGKRKRAETEPFLKVVDNPGTSEDFLLTFLSKLDSKRYSEIFSFLLNDEGETFFRECWEVKPCHFKRNLEANVFFGDILSKKSFLDIIKNTKLGYEDNFKVLRYDGIDRELWNP